MPVHGAGHIIIFINNKYFTWLGERAIRECIDEGRAVADKCSGPERSVILQICDDLDELTKELADMMRRGMVGLLNVVL